MRYAAYGSNLHPLRLKERTSSARLLGTDVLGGWRVEFHKRSIFDGSAKCTLVTATSDLVHVAVYEIADEQRSLLDAAEGLGRGYVLERIQLAAHGACWTYVADPAYVEPALKPYRWYRDLVVAGCEFHGFPRPYVDRLRDTPAVKDPDEDRRTRNMTLVRRTRERP
jgi:gamma-glutamylcyclotransferase (GGCT)/AIG2-like uncharacterized protein YtfP